MVRDLFTGIRAAQLLSRLILVLGVAYKADIDDTRESPSLDIMETLRERGAKIDYSDPFVPSLQFAGRTLRSVPLSPAKLRSYDCIVIATAHSKVPYGLVLRHGKAVVDTRNALKGRRSPKITRILSHGTPTMSPTIWPSAVITDWPMLPEPARTRVVPSPAVVRAWSCEPSAPRAGLHAASATRARVTRAARMWLSLSDIT